MRIGVVRETAPGERRVAIVPAAVSRLTTLGAEVLIERDAGAGAYFPDAEYAQVGARIVSREELYAESDAVLSVGASPDDLPGLVRRGQAVVVLWQPGTRPELVDGLAEAGATLITLAGVPRTLSRAQTMDALSSQANVAGYQAVLMAAAAYPRYFPMLITAAGTARPAEVLVLGAGVAGLQAIGTARRLGAVVRGYDVRPDTREQVESVGGEFVELEAVEGGAGSGGYARALTGQEQRSQQEQLAGQIARHDVVVTTAQVPGKPPPVLVTAEAVKAMRPGSVIVDLAAGPFGGNVALSRPEETVTTDNAVTIIGAGNLPSAMAPASSTAYSRNLCALLEYLVDDGELGVEGDDEIRAGVVALREGRSTRDPEPTGNQGGATR
ncbi:MAG: Re/Si-specific NAD(P)(+) transhydrogenase subunit alpha [Actinocatenispora sp.]